MYTLNLLLLYQITFQYAFWDKFKDLGSLSSANLTNLRFLLTHLIVTRSLSLAVVRVSTRVTLSHLHNHILMTLSKQVVEFSELSKVGIRWFKQLLQLLLCEYSSETCRYIHQHLMTIMIAAPTTP